MLQKYIENAKSYLDFHHLISELSNAKKGALQENLMEEVFFFLYHLHLDREHTLCMPINERKWVIERFIEQKNKENEAMESARRKASRK